MADIILNMRLTNFSVCLLWGWFDIIWIVLQNTQITSWHSDSNVDQEFVMLHDS
jgi:hypothetical protein